MHLKVGSITSWQLLAGRSRVRYTSTIFWSKRHHCCVAFQFDQCFISKQKTNKLNSPLLEFRWQWPWTTRYKDGDRNRCLIPKVNLDCVAVPWIERHSLNHCAASMKFLVKEQQCVCLAAVGDKGLWKGHTGKVVRGSPMCTYINVTSSPLASMTGWSAFIDQWIVIWSNITERRRKNRTWGDGKHLLSGDFGFFIISTMLAEVGMCLFCYSPVCGRVIWNQL